MSRAFHFASRGSSILRRALSLGAGIGVALAANAAHAQEPEPLPPPAQEAAPAPAITCALGEHAGIERADAETVRDLFAHELAARRAPSGNYEVRIGKLGSRMLLVLSEKRSDNSYDERRTLITNIEEASVAAPRLVDALVNGKPVEETQTVSNVLTNEARAPIQKQGRPGFIGGVIGVTPITVQSGVAAGADAGIVYESDRFALIGLGRLAGGSSGTDYNFTYFNLGVGARYFITDGDFAPYVGGGAGFSAYSVDTPNGNPSASSSGYDKSTFNSSGFNLHGEVGIEAFRTHHVSALGGLRLDAPLFAVSDGTARKYAMPVSLTVGLIFK